MRTVDGVPARTSQPRLDEDDASEPGWTRWLRPIVFWAGGLAAAIVAASFFTLWALDALNEPAIVIDDPLLDMTIVVAVGGAVATPGIYELPAGARVQHLLDLAGGVLHGADLAAVNPALRVQDGEQILIPTLGEPTPQGVAAVEPMARDPEAPLPLASDVPDSVPSSEPRTLDINTASLTELETLPGIGPAKAAAIVAYRDQHGPFASIDDLEHVEGISDAMVADLAPLIYASQ